MTIASERLMPSFNHRCPCCDELLPFRNVDQPLYCDGCGWNKEKAALWTWLTIQGLPPPNAAALERLFLDVMTKGA